MNTLGAERRHWPEYLIEAVLLGLFMLSACGFSLLLEHPASPVPVWLPEPAARRLAAGIAMAFTAVSLIYSPWGQRSGAHMNPAMTLVFFRLGKIESRDALFYALAQFVGAVLGVFVASALFGAELAHSSVRYAVTLPGEYGPAAAFGAELVISFALAAAVLRSANDSRTREWTGVCAAVLIALYITFEAPFSGMSMNPARTLGSALFAGRFDGIWVYFVAPPLGMLLAAELHVRAGRKREVFCAKLQHGGDSCIFRCRYDELLNGKGERQ
ncbi:MAG TPA: aquaporin [Polyangiaceae bacterium]